ncbi:unnamed protein product [Gadus morhua 'NCC']
MRRRRASGLQNREKTVTKSRTQSGVMVGRRATAVLVVLLCLWGGGVPSGALAGAVECPTTEGVGRSGVDMPSAVVDIQKAESSQRHHLEALFNRYGENGTISLASLKSLLQNIGLDRVRTVTVQHRHHHHHGDHPHGDNDAHNLSLTLTDSRPSTAARLSDSPEQQAPSPGRGPGAGHRRRRADGDGPTGRGLDGDHHHQDHDDHDDPHHDHDEHHRDPLDQVHRDQPLHHHHGHNQDTDHEHHDGHRRLGLGGPDTAPDRSLGSTECQNASEVLRTHGMARDVALTLGDFRYLCPALLHQISSGSCILHRDPAGHGATGNDSHTHNHSRHGNHDHEDRRGDSRKSVATAWAGGFVSITIISLLCSFNFLLSFLVALAVGTLSGDAFLHLIPHSQATHHLHHHHNHHEVAGPEGAGPGLHGDQEENLDGVWKGLTALSGVYVMFLIEHFLTLGKMYKDRKKIQKKWDSRDKDLEEVPALEENHLKPHEDAEANGGGALAEEQQLMLAPAESSAAAAAAGAGHTRPPDAAYTDQDCEHKCHSHFHDTVGQSDHHHHHDYHHILHHHHSQNHHPHSHAQSYSQEHFEQVGVAALAWMVIVGDGLRVSGPGSCWYGSVEAGRPVLLIRGLGQRVRCLLLRGLRSGSWSACYGVWRSGLVLLLRGLQLVRYGVWGRRVLVLVLRYGGLGSGVLVLPVRGSGGGSGFLVHCGVHGPGGVLVLLRVLVLVVTGVWGSGSWSCRYGVWGSGSWSCRYGGFWRRGLVSAATGSGGSWSCWYGGLGRGPWGPAGAAFSEGLSSGLSTSVAVFCHELPHELGDFAVLLKSGMTVRQAILYNVLSAMMAYLGMGVGIVIGHYAENVSMWIFALTAGLFMYVALVDMMPEMLHNNAGEQGVGHCGFFLLQNAGILLGFAIMLLIAVFEHKIQLDLGY